MKEYPTPWQRKMMWAALTAFFVVVLIGIFASVIWAGASIISFSAANTDPGGDRCDSYVFARPAGDENVLVDR